MLTSPTWTTERVESLKAHFADGLSCRQIAVAIGVSRNAVIGKLSRLGLAREKIVDESRPRMPRERRRRSMPRLQYEALKQAYATISLPDVPVISEQRCSLFELSKERCRWPVNSETEAFSFCGNAPLAGMPYCTGHTRLAYRSLARRAG